ncbi:MAG: RNA-binding S4 domain-containing protein [Xanthomonadales bacterium]|nr:RNA-binding S4 domain-containing protein [Xanthomonadales bacterium]
MRKAEIRREPIELYRLLKFEGMASSGGEAKTVIAGGLVRVNGECETRKRRKILAGDIVEFAGERIEVALP